MTKYIYIISAAIVAILCLSACQHDDDGPAVAKERFRIKACVGDFDFSRTVNRDDDGFSVAAFSDGDMCGFFSQNGNNEVASGEFENVPMKFENGYFVGGENMSVDINRLGKTLLYFPYKNAPYGRQPVRDEKTGEVKDILLSLSVGNPDANESALVARFSHLFSMLMIKGGYGFENFHKKDVSVTLSEPVETVEFRRSTDPDNAYGYWVCLNGEYKENNTQPSDTFATVKGHYNSGKEEYYVIIPTGDSIAVMSINVYDDSGRLHKIKVTPNPKDAIVESGKRYKLTLELDELTPTIYLHQITPWDDGIDLEANKEKGISSASDLGNWITQYNSVPHNDDELLRYGDKVEVKDAGGNIVDKYWRFYLTADIDLTGMNDESAHLVNTLKDEFDGCGYTITGLSYSNKGNAAMFNRIEGDHACVKNLTVDNMVVNATGGESDAVGALVTNFVSGSIENCTFTNLSIHAINSAVGVLAGEITGGDNAIVKNCKFSGAIFGKSSTDSRIAGRGAVSNEVIKGCDTSNVMFGQI